MDVRKVYLFYSSTECASPRRPLSPEVKLEAIFASPVEAAHCAITWIASGHYDLYGLHGAIEDLHYKESTGGRCVRYWTPFPETKEVVLKAWTVEAGLVQATNDQECSDS